MAKIITDFSAVTTVGLDLAKNVFQVHGADAAGHFCEGGPAQGCYRVFHRSAALPDRHGGKARNGPDESSTRRSGNP